VRPHIHLTNDPALGGPEAKTWLKPAENIKSGLFEAARRRGNKPHEFFLVLLTKTTAQAQAALYRKNKPARTKPVPQAERKKPP